MKAFYSNGGKRKARTFGSWQEPNCWNNYRQMARRSFLVLVFLLFAAGGLGLAETPIEAARAMVEAERKFYQTGQEQGTRAAFLAFLADDAIVFRPGPVNGKETWSKRPETGLDLVWEPIFAVMARSADFGFDTGPAKWRGQKTDPKFAGYGYFISVWKKQKDGSWKVALDCGNENPEPAGKPETLRIVGSDKESKTKSDPEAARKKLQEAQKKFAEAAKAGSGKAALAVASDDIRVYRNGHFPAVGLSAGGGILTAQDRNLAVEPMGGDVSRSADLAYSYGKYSTLDAGPGEQGHYLHIWQADAAGAWKLVLDWQQPLPEKK
ncbi:MAG: nuclear transport factor 2 family protein [Chthoniobacterales bacterium]